jgi:16S rRNA processing protein RimM
MAAGCGLPPGMWHAGRIAGVHGVRGAVKVYSYTEPPAAIVDYNPWQLCVGGEWRQYRVLGGGAQGRGVVVQLEGVSGRDEALTLRDVPVALLNSQRAVLPPGEYYWSDLEGLRVVTPAGVELGRVAYLFATGSNDVLVVRDEAGGERLVPYTPGHAVLAVEPEAGRMVVDDEAL